MNKVIRTARIALALAFVGLIGCAVAPTESTSVEETGEATEALSTISSRIDYYSDATYTTLVGSKAMSCTGASSSWGIKTQFIIGEYDSCRDYEPLMGCYQLECGGGICWQACNYNTCVDC